MFVTILALTSTIAMAQKVELLYFKANLACCAAKSCATLEKDIKAIVDKNFTSKEVMFKTVKIEDEANKAIVEKHKAKSQTVVMVSKKKKKEQIADLSDIIRKYQRNGNKEEFEKELVARIKAVL